VLIYEKVISHSCCKIQNPKHLLFSLESSFVKKRKERRSFNQKEWETLLIEKADFRHI
jgi:hypothetical protein